MPFKSEKQRRFLWSQHPDIAKRWAHEYPGQKNLPLYAHKKKTDDTKQEKAATMDEFNSTFDVNATGRRIYEECVKKAESSTVKVEIPHSDKPVAAGEEHVTATDSGCESDSPIQTRNEDEVNLSREELAGEHVNNSGENPLLKKLAVVLSQPIMQAIENEKAEREARMAAKMPQNVGIKRYAMPANTTPLPMGMQQPAQPAQPQQPQAAQPQQQGAGMNSPSANPINSFGALSMDGNINGNASFGIKNSPDSSKSANAYNPELHKLLQQWADAGGSQSAYPMSANYQKKPAALPKQLAAALRKHYELPEQSIPDETDAAQALMFLEDERPSNANFPAKFVDKDGFINIPMKGTPQHAALMGAKTASAKPCSCGCGDTVGTCKCPAACSCRKPGGSCYKGEKSAGTPAWQRSAGKNEEGGLNEKGRKSYEREHGGNLKAPVTESNPSGERAKRQNSFCSRMCGMKRVNTGASTAKDPDSRINKSLRKWNCKCSAMQLHKLAAGPFPQVGPPQADGSPTKLDTSPVGRMMQYFTGKPGYRTDWDKMPAGKPYVPPAPQPLPMQQGWQNLKDRLSTKSSASQLYKSARPLGLDDYSSFAGPDQIQHAVQQYGRLKALVRPDDSTLRARGLNRSGFQGALRNIVSKSQGQDRYNLSEIAPNPKRHAAIAAGIGALGTAGLGYLGGMEGASVGLAGTGIGAGLAYMNAAKKREDILNTAKLMKEYGLLKPKTLQHAYPLLADDYKFASAEEFVNKAAELAVARQA